MLLKNFGLRNGWHAVSCQIPRLRRRYFRNLARRGAWAELYQSAVPSLVRIFENAEERSLVIDAAIQLGCESDLQSRLKSFPSFPSPGVEIHLETLRNSAEIRVTRQLEERLAAKDYVAALALTREYHQRWGVVPKAPVLRLGQELRHAQSPQDEQEICRFLREQFPDDPDVAFLALSIAMREREWTQAIAIYQNELDAVEPKDFGLRFARIRVLVQSGRTTEALQWLEQERDGDRYPQQLLPLACVIRSEQGEWQQFYEIAIRQLDELPPNEQILYGLIKAARKTGHVRDLWERLSQLPVPQPPGLRRVISSLLEDLAESGSDVCDLPGFAQLQEQRRDQLRLKAPDRNIPAGASPKFAIFYCTDSGFLRPMLVSLVSLCQSNPLLARNAEFLLLSDPETFERLSHLARLLAERLGVTIRVLSSAEIVPEQAGLRCEYGFFTGGKTLSLAAYYRIFLARELAKRGGFTQGIYIDADTLVRRGLAELFALPMQHPLMACPDTDRPEVRRAVSELGLKGWYFNSGVLRFDFQNPALLESLETSIQCALDSTRKLHFQDQCALNVGFDGRVERLPTRFNHQVSPKSHHSREYPPETVILHFIDQPKPWDSYYADAAIPWFEGLQNLQNVLQEEFLSLTGNVGRRS